MKERPYEVVRDGCATGWSECPHGDEAITVIYAGQRWTSCIRRPKVSADVSTVDAVRTGTAE